MCPHRTPCPFQLHLYSQVPFRLNIHCRQTQHCRIELSLGQRRAAKSALLSFSRPGGTQLSCHADSKSVAIFCPCIQDPMHHAMYLSSGLIPLLGCSRAAMIWISSISSSGCLGAALKRPCAWGCCSSRYGTVCSFTTHWLFQTRGVSCTVSDMFLSYTILSGSCDRNNLCCSVFAARNIQVAWQEAYQSAVFYVGCSCNMLQNGWQHLFDSVLSNKSEMKTSQFALYGKLTAILFILFSVYGNLLCNFLTFCEPTLCGVGAM